MIGRNSPWGRIDYAERIAPGIWRVETPSHGGLYVEKELLRKIPLQWRACTAGAHGMHGWFEEDCDWQIVAIAFPELFPDVADRAKAALQKKLLTGSWI